MSVCSSLLMLRAPEKLNALPAPTTSSALEDAITMGEESAKLLSRKVTWGRVGVKVRVRVSVRVRVKARVRTRVRAKAKARATAKARARARARVGAPFPCRRTRGPR